MRAGIYGRLSVVRTRDDDRRNLETSTDRQVRDCFEWVRRQDGEIVRTYRDEGISAFTGAYRPDFERLLTDLRSGIIDTLVCWKLDRLARSHSAFQRLWDACEASGARLVSLHELFDTATPAGEFTVRLLIGMAKMESDNISLRVKRALRAHREAGRLHTGGGRPFGHTWKGELVPHEAAIVRWAALRVLAGDGLITICNDMKDRGIVGTKGRPIGRRALKRLLTAPRTIGLVEHQGEILGPGGFTPILQRATWEQTRVVLFSPGRTREPRPIRYLLVGWLVCGVDGCDGRLVTRPVHGRRSYVCVETGKVHLSVAAEPVEQLITERILDRLDRVGLAHVLAVQADSADARELGERIAADEATLLQLGDDYADRTINKPTYLRQKGRLEERIRKDRDQLAKLAARQQLHGLPAGEGALRAAWEGGRLDLHQRRIILGLVLDRRIVVRPADRPRRSLDPDRVVIPKDTWRV